MKKKIFSMLVLLMTAVTGAVAQEETLLTTITPTGDGTYSETTAGAVTVSPAGSFFYSGSTYGWRWDSYGTLTVTANEGYTITRCVFIQQGNNQSVTISEAPFELNFEEFVCYENYSMDGVTSIEVYGTAPAAAATTNYYLVGTMNDWGASKQFLLTQNPSNEAEYMITLTLKAGAELKVIGVGENTTWYPGDGGNYKVTNAGKYTVYFRPDGQGGDGWHYGYIYLAAAPAPAIPLTEVGSNEWTFEMPDYAVVANVEYETELELMEENVNTTVLADWDGYEADVTLKRTLTAGMWNTLALPFSVATPDGWTVKKLSSSELSGETLTLNFDNASSIEAGKPYLVIVSTTTDLLQVPFSSAIVSKEAVPVETTFVDFIPTLGKTNIAGDDATSVLFLAAENKLKNPSSLPSDMKGFRAYFQLKNASAARSFSLNLGDKETGIMAIDHSPLNTDQSVYDLQGRRMANGQSSTVDGQSLKKGVYIVNGKKTIIK